MRVKLAVAFAVLLFAPLAHADEINTPTGILIIPDGSTVTAFGIAPPPTPLIEELFGTQYFVDYSFADGTGETAGNALASYSGVVNFSSPVSELTFSWVQGAVPFFFSDNMGASFTAPDDVGCCVFSGTVTLTGTDISQIEWSGGDLLGGITSMSYTVDASVPEPSSLLLSGMGLAALIGLARRNRAR